MWCVESWWLADLASTDKFSEPCGVWKAADLLTVLKQSKKSNTCGVQNGADLLTLNKESKFSNHMVCEKLLTCWLWCLEEKIQTHVVCEMVLTCWLLRKNLNFPIIWCVKSCWLADLASTNKFSEPCGVWKAADLLTLLNKTKKSNHVLCEKPLTCWLADLLTADLLTADLLTADLLTCWLKTHVVCEMVLIYWLC